MARGKRLRELADNGNSCVMIFMADNGNSCVMIVNLLYVVSSLHLATIHMRFTADSVTSKCWPSNITANNK